MYLLYDKIFKNYISHLSLHRSSSWSRQVEIELHPLKISRSNLHWSPQWKPSELNCFGNVSLRLSKSRIHLQQTNNRMLPLATTRLPGNSPLLAKLEALQNTTNSMELVIPLHWLCWSIHTKDESKRGTAFAFIFGVNWLWHCGVTASFGVM